MYLSQVSDHVTLIKDGGLSARMEEGLSRSRIVGYASVHSGLIKEFLHHALHSEEIAVSVHAQGKLHPLVRKLCQRQALGKVYIGKLIQADVFISPVVVGG